MTAKLESVWSNMKDRCYNRRCHAYQNYGGRGIQVCVLWFASPKPFIEWALATGYKEGLYLDRKHPDDNYSPETCRWVTPKESINNRRNTVYLTVAGETKSIADWCADPRCAVDFRRIHKRLSRGWTASRAVLEPARSNYPR